jgi:tRNA (guanine10-N2)-methyltransferase
MEYMIRLIQAHDTFRLPELEALAVLEEVTFEVIFYSPTVCSKPSRLANARSNRQQSPFLIVKMESEEAARKLVQRSITAKAVYEVWGSGSTFEALRESVKSRSMHVSKLYKQSSFRFSIDSFQGSRSPEEFRQMVEGFSFLEFEGVVKMKKPDQEFCILEEWSLESAVTEFEATGPLSIHLGRFLGGTDRDCIQKYDLKKRRYISTTSMDSELALITANISLAAPGKLFYDPFVGTGSFPVACSHFGALSFGSDIDGRSIRGKGKANLLSNFVQYGLTSRFGDTFVADLTNTPLRAARLFDGIICDPPYGVREGLKVLGNRDQTKPKGPIYQGGDAHHL